MSTVVYAGGGGARSHTHTHTRARARVQAIVQPASLDLHHRVSVIAFHGAVSSDSFRRRLMPCSLSLLTAGVGLLELTFFWSFTVVVREEPVMGCGRM